MLFPQDRGQARAVFQRSWRKYLEGIPLEPLEAVVVDVVLRHPEFHGVLTAQDVNECDTLVEPGEGNPFLHLGLHVAVQEQNRERPPARDARAARAPRGEMARCARGRAPHDGVSARSAAGRHGGRASPGRGQIPGVRATPRWNPALRRYGWTPSIAGVYRPQGVATPRVQRRSVPRRLAGAVIAGRRYTGWGSCGWWAHFPPAPSSRRSRPAPRRSVRTSSTPWTPR